MNRALRALRILVLVLMVSFPEGRHQHKNPSPPRAARIPGEEKKLWNDGLNLQRRSDVKSGKG